MKKALLLLMLLAITAVFQTRPVYAVSHGYEGYQDDICNAHVRYFPVVPYDPNFPTACEDFAIEFDVYQKSFWTTNFPFHSVPSFMWIQIWFKDVDCGVSDYVSLEHVYPTSVTYYGWNLGFSITFDLGYVSLSLTLGGTPSSTFYENNTKENAINGWVSLGYSLVLYGTNFLSDGASLYGVIRLAVRNDWAQPHQGHHVLVNVEFLPVWTDGTQRPILFHLGDDDPADTDCWFTVEQGTTQFTMQGPPGSGGGCPTLFVWNGTDYAEEGTLDIHAESDVTVQHGIQNTLALENGVYKLQLRELDEYTSHIDQVKLYAVNNQGRWSSCPLTDAQHNSLGNIKGILRYDDENRVDL